MRGPRHALAALALGLPGAGCLEGAYTAARPTALERQLLGAYDELDTRLVHAASVRGQGRELLSFEALEARAIEARALQRFNEDDLSDLEAAGCVAEARGARVVSRPCDRLEADDLVARTRARVVEEENAAREAIIAWAAHAAARQEGRGAPTPAEVEALRDAYARLLRETARPGVLVEVAPGEFRPAAD
jgi:hypothetical protein